MSKINLEEATLKALYDDLNQEKETSNVEGIVNDVIVVTDPEITTDEYEEVIEKAQEIVEDTPEGELPFSEDYIGQYLQTCPICGSTFITKNILEPGATCPVCLEQPEAFVTVGRLEGNQEENSNEEEIEELQKVDNEEEIVHNEEGNQEEENSNEEEIVHNEEENIEKDLASKQISGDKLEESKKIPVSDILAKAKEILPETDIETHESDVYIKVTDQSKALINQLQDKDNGLLKIFKSEKDGLDWYEIPFANLSNFVKSKKEEDIIDNELTEEELESIKPVLEKLYNDFSYSANYEAETKGVQLIYQKILDFVNTIIDELNNRYQLFESNKKDEIHIIETEDPDGMQLHYQKINDNAIQFAYYQNNKLVNGPFESEIYKDENGKEYFKDEDSFEWEIETNKNKTEESKEKINQTLGEVLQDIADGKYDYPGAEIYDINDSEVGEFSYEAIKLTEEGKEYFKDVLNIPVVSIENVDAGIPDIYVDAGNLARKLDYFLQAAAGYIDENKFNLYFDLDAYLGESKNLDDRKLKQKIKTWYKKEYKDDKDMIKVLNDTATFADLKNALDTHIDVYEIIFKDDTGDSIVRERLFTQLAELLNVDYDEIYNKWLEESNEDIKNDEILNETKSIKLDDLKQELDKVLNKAVMELGFEEDEVKDVAFIEIAAQESDIKITLHAEFGYDTTIEILSKLDKVISKYDKEAYFDCQEPGLSIAIIENTLLKEEKIEESNKVTDYIDEKELKKLIANNPILSLYDNEWEFLDGMIMHTKGDHGDIYYKVIVNDNNELETYWISKQGQKLGDAFVI